MLYNESIMKMLVVLQNIIQYKALKPLLLHVKNRKLWKFDIFIYGLDEKDTSGFSNISKELKLVLLEDGFDSMIKTKLSKQDNYKVCMTPYAGMVNVNCTYLISFYYGSASSKPFTFAPESKMMFHGAFLHSTYDADLLSVYSKTYIVPNLRLRNKKSPRKQHKSEKKVLLYLPTYGEINNIHNIHKSLVKLKSKYYIITKGHHGTEHLKSEINKKQMLLDLSDEYYTPEKDINELFKMSDVVLSDNSGAIFDALYTGVPVCIAAKNINNKFGNLDTLQSKLVTKGIIPYSDKTDVQSIGRLLVKTLQRTTLKKQAELAREIFTNRDSGLKDWIKILSEYMKDEVSQDYVSLHNIYTDQWTETRRQLEGCRKELNLAKANLEGSEILLNKTREEFSTYRKAKLHRFADKIYKERERLRRKFNNE